MHETHPIVSHDAWIAARKQLLAREKEFTRLRDELSRARRDLPWERVEKAYLFHTTSGPVSLAELFGDKRQLVVYHFMFAPDWEAGCKSCSFWADNFNGVTAHFAQRDVSFTAISRAPLAKLQAYANRMGWSFPWASSSESDFNFDYAVSFRPGDKTYNYAPLSGSPQELPGISVFYRDGNEVFHTYSAYARGIDHLNTAYSILDLVPNGRSEDGLDYPMAWVRRHDEYGR